MRLKTCPNPNETIGPIPLAGVVASSLGNIEPRGGPSRLPIAIVGGCVRDLVLGFEPKDWDVVVEGKPSLWVSDVASWLETRGGTSALSDVDIAF